MRMTRKVETQAMSWPSNWLPERHITPDFTFWAKAGSRCSSGGASSAAAAGCESGASITSGPNA